MLYNKRVAVLGGDMRQVSLARYFSDKGHTVCEWGLPPSLLVGDVAVSESWQGAIKDAGLIVLPLPASPDSKHLNLPLLKDEREKPPRVADIVCEMPRDALLAGGRISPMLKEIISGAGVRFFDYFESELLQQKNAIPTAEGAVEVLMHQIPRTVRDLPVAITGFGRVAQALAALLLAMGAKVTVAARKTSALELAAKMGCDTVHIDGKGALSSLGQGYAAIFNTVPYWLFDESVLRELSKETLLIDLSSAPGGVDANAAAALGIRVIFALSLPGKYAPQTAGEIIAETILSHIEEEQQGVRGL